MVEILGVNIDKVTMKDAVKKADSFFDGKPHMVFTPNPEIILECEKDENLKNIINSADLKLPDGIGIVIASKLLNNPVKDRVSGFDYVCELLKTNRSFYLFGGKPGIAQKAADNLINNGVNVVGFHDGYFNDDREIIEDIKEKNPDILIVCLGAPKQEKWICKNLKKLNVPVSIGAGGSLDVLAGEVKRAPEIYQKLCLEWLYRTLKEPKKRIPRIIKLPVFII
ncbi:MAG: WecB/TagA/CpsF family glycosyltransferase, partial [Clostridia bacterium]|nr:WecB/TagA/CpsF family glycosyltransferase [Clostridia bacterium]